MFRLISRQAPCWFNFGIKCLLCWLFDDAPAFSVRSPLPRKRSSAEARRYLRAAPELLAGQRSADEGPGRCVFRQVSLAEKAPQEWSARLPQSFLAVSAAMPGSGAGPQ